MTETEAEAKSDLAHWIRQWLGKELKRTPEDIDGETMFVRYGLDSVQAMMLVGDLEDRLNRRLPPTLAWDYPPADSMAAFLVASQPVNIDAADLISRLDELSEEEIDRLLAGEANHLTH
jgi:acyl carrier protein